jgi:hypothetical protein
MVILENNPGDSFKGNCWWNQTIKLSFKKKDPNETQPKMLMKKNYRTTLEIDNTAGFIK